MATENLGRNINISNADISQGMLSSVKEISKSTNSIMESNNSILELIRITEASSKNNVSIMESIRNEVQRIAEIVSDKSLTSEVNSAKAHVGGVVNVRNEMQNVKDKSTKNSKDPVQLNMSNVLRKLYTEAKKQNTLWFGVSKFGSRAQQQLLKIIHSKSTLSSANARAMGAAGAAGGTGGTGGTGTGGTGTGGTGTGGTGTGGTGTGGTGGGGTGGGGTGGGGTGGGGTGGGWRAGGTQFLIGAHVVAQKLEIALSALDINLNNVYAGIIQDENRFRMNMRQTVYEIAGFSSMNRELEQGYKDVDNAVAITGMNRSEYMKLHLKNIQRGIAFENKGEKDAQKNHVQKLKRLKAVTQTAAFTARQLNMDADAMNDVFMNWHIALGMTNNQLNQVGRSLQTIARSTGLTGANLESAVKTAAKFAKQMRSSGTLSAESLATVTEFSALFAKYDISEYGEEIMGALTSYRGFLDASSQTQAMLARAASNDVDLARAIQNGTVLKSKTMTAKLSKAYTNDVIGALGALNINNDYVHNVLGMSEDINADTMGKIIKKMGEVDSDRLAHLDLFANQVYGKGIGEVVASVKAMAEQSKPLSQKIDEMEKNLLKMNADGSGGTARAKELDASIKQMKEDAYQTAFGKLADLREGNNKSIADVAPEWLKGLEETLGKPLADKFRESATGTGDFGAEASKLMMNLMQDKAKLVGADLTKILESKKQAGGPDITIDTLQKGLLSDDSGEQQSANLILAEVMKELATTEKANADPATKLAHELQLLNEWLRSTASTLFGMIPEEWQSFALKAAAWTTAIISATLALGGFLWSLMQIYAAIRGTIALLRGGGAAAAAAAAAAAGGGGVGGGVGGGGTGRGGRSRGSRGSRGARGSRGSRGARGGGRSRGLLGLALAAAGTAYTTHEMGLWGGDAEDVNAGGGGVGGDWGDGNPLPVYLVNWEDLCSCIGGTGGGIATGNGIPTGINNARGGIERFQNQIGNQQSDMSNIAAPDSGLSDLGVDLGMAVGNSLPSPSVGRMLGLQQAAPTFAQSIPAAPSIPGAAKSGGGFLSRMWGSAKGAAGNAWSATKGAAGDAWSATKGAAASTGQYVLDKTGISKVTQFLSGNIGKIMPQFLKTSWGVVKGGTANILNKIPVIGAIIEAIATGMDINEISKDQGLSKEEIYSQIGSAIIGNGMGLIGGTLAASVISAPGALGIPSWLLAPMAYMGGHAAGSMIGSAISDYIGGPTLGKMIFDMFYGDRPNVATSESTEASLNSFQVGTREITQAGVANLHEGEVVVPKQMWQKIQAVGNGPFGNDTDIQKQIWEVNKGMHLSKAPPGLFNKLKTPQVNMGETYGMSNTDIQKLTWELNKGMHLSKAPPGLFDKLKTEKENKSEDGLFDKLIKFMPTSLMGMGSGTKSAIFEPNDFFNKIITTFSNMYGLTSPSISDQIGTEQLIAARDGAFKGAPTPSPIDGGLFDPENNIISAILAGIQSVIKLPFMSNLNSNQKSSPETSTNPIDYSDETRQAQVSTSMYSKDDAETYIERNKYGSSTNASSAMIPSMEVIAEYLLNTQSEKLDRIIAELVGIRQNTSIQRVGSGTSEVEMGDTSSTSGLKSIGDGNIRGFWGLQAGAFSPSNNNSDGRR